MEKLVIIDGNSLINRAFYALPMLSNKDGEFSNAVYGFTTMLIKTIEDHKPTHIVVAFDYGKKTFRHNIYAEYKGTRKGTPEELKSQFPILKELLNAMHIKMFEKEGIEADDIIGTIAHKLDVPTVIVTGDKDALQLINPTTIVWLNKKGISEVKTMDEKALYDEYALTPKQIIDLKALMGDSSDNIPGVAGIGEKTALTLMQQYNSLDNIYENIDKISGKLQEKLVLGKESAYLSKTLATIDTHVDIDINLKDFTYDFPFSAEVYEIFRRYQFNSLLKRNDLFNDGIQKDVEFDGKIKKHTLTDVKEIEKIVKNIKGFAFLMGDKISFAVDERNVYEIDCQPSLFQNTIEIDSMLNALKNVFENDKVKKIVFDAKDLMHKLNKYNICLKGLSFDCLLASYLINAGDKTPKYQETLTNYNLDEQFGAANLFVLEKKLKDDLEKYNLTNLYNNVELPLVNVLFDMEQVGFKIDKKVLNDLSVRYKDELVDLTKVICSLAGEEFNINSPKQLAEILFNKLGLQAWNNKKKSTGVDILEELQDKHPIVPLIMRYRKIQKLSKTYLEPYQEILKEQEKIHTIFNQTLTATGRLSSSEPNLQNIPVRDDEGKYLRKLFVPSDKNGFIISADYSQIELRLLAHFSQDEKLLEAYRTGKDIHAQTASEVFGVPFADVTPALRRQAKAVNFGIIYGISEFGLAQNVGCSRKEAKQYIDIYFERYAKVKEYMQRNIAMAKDVGYVSTLFGRIRRVNEIFSPNYMTRQFGERISMNMPLQGTASDIIKIAMIKVYNRLKSEDLKSKLILQIHDELIVDTAPNEVGQVCKILKEEMENAAQLSVPLLVDVSCGKDWFEAN